jgi:myosin heavy subunit
MPEPTPASAVSVKEIEEQIESLKTVLREIQDEVTVLHNAKQESQIWTPSQDQMDALRSTTQRLEADIADIEKEIEQAKQHAEEMKNTPQIAILAGKEEQVKQMKELLEQLKEQNKELLSKESELQAKVKELKAKNTALDQEIAKVISPQLKVSIPQNSDKTAYIIVYGQEGLTIIPTDGSLQQKFTSQSDFYNWVNQRNNQTEYFVLYVRPSRFGHYDEILDQLKGKEFDVGLQVIDEKTHFILKPVEK